MKVSIERFDVGPILGAVSPDSARLWGRGREPRKGVLRRMFGAARFRKKGESTYSPAQHFKLNPNFDLTGVTVLHSLKADTDYEYEIGAFAADIEFEHLSGSNGPQPNLVWKEAHQGSFRTASKDIIHSRFRAANNNVSRWRGPSSPSPRSSWPMSQRAISIPN